MSAMRPDAGLLGCRPQEHRPCWGQIQHRNVDRDDLIDASIVLQCERLENRLAILQYTQPVEPVQS